MIGKKKKLKFSTIWGHKRKRKGLQYFNMVTFSNIFRLKLRSMYANEKNKFKRFVLAEQLRYLELLDYKLPYIKRYGRFHNLFNRKLKSLSALERKKKQVTFLHSTFNYEKKIGITSFGLKKNFLVRVLYLFRLKKRYDLNINTYRYFFQLKKKLDYILKQKLAVGIKSKKKIVLLKKKFSLAFKLVKKERLKVSQPSNKITQNIFLKKRRLKKIRRKKRRTRKDLKKKISEGAGVLPNDAVTSNTKTTKEFWPQKQKKTFRKPYIKRFSPRVFRKKSFKSKNTLKTKPFMKSKKKKYNRYKYRQLRRCTKVQIWRELFRPRFFFYHVFFSHLQTVLNYSVGEHIRLKIIQMPPGLYTAAIILRYILTKLRMRYRLSEIVKPLLQRMKETTLGFKAKCSGRFTRRERASLDIYRHGSIPVGTYATRLTYVFGTTPLKYGAVGIKIYLHY